MTDDKIRAAANVACCSLVCRAFEQLSLPLANLTLELHAESGPYKQGAKSHASTANGILRSVGKLLLAKLKFRQFLASPKRVDILLEELPRLLSRLKKQIFLPLRRAAVDEDEQSAKKTVERVKAAARKLSADANKGSNEALKILDQTIQGLFPQLPEQKRESSASDASISAAAPVNQTMTCVSIDLSQYGALAAMLEEVADVEALFEFNQKIQNFFAKTLKSMNVPPDNIPTFSTGDGALLFFPRPTQAFRFAQLVQNDAVRQNRNKQDQHKKRYRIGLATGELVLQETRSKSGSLLGFSIAGMAIVKAVRLQAKCELDQILICENTYLKIPQKCRRACGEVEVVKGKEHETWTISARRAGFS